MENTQRFNKKECELVYNVHEGDTIRIIKLDDPFTPRGSYIGREGKVTHIDSMGQLHGTWGGLAVIPGEDRFEVIKHEEIPGKVYLFHCTFGTKIIELFAPNTPRATEIFTRNFGPNKNPKFTLVREATEEEYEEIENTGASSPNKGRRN